MVSAFSFSTFSTPTWLHFTIGFYICGHLNDLVGIGAEQKNNLLWSGALR